MSNRVAVLASMPLGGVGLFACSREAVRGGAGRMWPSSDHGFTQVVGAGHSPATYSAQ